MENKTASAVASPVTNRGSQRMPKVVVKEPQPVYIVQTKIEGRNISTGAIALGEKHHALVSEISKLTGKPMTTVVLEALNLYAGLCYDRLDGKLLPTSEGNSLMFNAGRANVHPASILREALGVN